MEHHQSHRWAWIVVCRGLSRGRLVLASCWPLPLENGERFEPQFAWLFWTNVAVAGLLLAVILFALFCRLCACVPASSAADLLLKLAGIFGLVGVVPGLLIYTIIPPVRVTQH